MSLRRIDWSSGQVYTEAAMAPALASSRGTSWVHESPFQPLGWEEVNDHGTHSLKHSAMRCILSDQRVLTPELFAGVPWHLAKYLWDCLGRMKQRTLYTWKVFAAAYPDQFPQVSRYRSMKIEGPKMPMRDYLGLVKCDLLTWRLVLTVATEYARVPELVDIATLKNLVALEFISPPQLQAAEEDTGVSTTTLNDRIIRTWSEIAKSSNAFKHLSVMRLYHQRDLSRVALRYLQDLPSLGFIIAHNCQGLTSAFSKDGPKAEGWEIVDIPEILEATRLYSCYTAMMDLDQEGGAASHHDIPFLDFQVGKSTHRANKSIRRITQPVCLRRCADPDTPEPIAKKPKLERGKRPQVKGNTPKKALMKYRKGKDLGDLLEEFM